MTGIHRALADVIVLDGETIPEEDGYEIFDPKAVWKRKKMSKFYAKNLRKQIFKAGKCVYERPSIDEIKSYCADQVGMLFGMRRRDSRILRHTMWIFHMICGR